MISPELLRKLGWSEDLISEVTRLADAVRGAAERVGSLPTAIPSRRPEAASALFLDEPSPSTGVQLSIGSLSAGRRDGKDIR